METDRNNIAAEDDVKKLLLTIREKESKLQKAELELKQVTKSRMEMYKIVKEKDETLAHKVLERIPDVERVLTESDENRSRLQSAKRKRSLNIQDEMQSEQEGHDKDKSTNDHDRLNHIKLQIGKHLIDIPDEKRFTKFQKEIFKYYANDPNEIEKSKSNVDLEEEVTNPEDIGYINWQYALVFKNPDFEAKPQKMDETKVLQLYDNCFWPDRRMKNNKSKKQENDVFKYILSKTVEKENKSNGTVYYNLNKGGSFKVTNEAKAADPKNSSKEEDTWNYLKDSQPKDILSLIRNITMFKLNKVLHLQTASILSEKGDLIYVLIHAPEELLKDHADWIEYPLQLEIGSTDLVSLEPCDDGMRPYLFIKEGKPQEISKMEEELFTFYTDTLYYADEFDVLDNQHISDPSSIPEKDWNAYKEFLKYLTLHKDDCLVLIQQHKQLEGLFIRELYERAFQHVKIELKYTLKNVWDYFGTKPVGAYKTFNRESEANLGQLDHFWRRHVYKDGKTSLFQDLDKIKLIISHMFSQLRLDRMLSLGMLVKYFPLHSKDYGEKDEDVQISMRNNELGELKEEILKKNNYEEEYKSTDPGNPVLKDKIKEKMTTFSNVKQKWTYNCLGKVPTAEIRDYFGEKVALYYEFLSFYTFYLFILGVLGVIVYIIQSQDSIQSKAIEYFSELGFKKSRLVIAFNTIYSFVVIIWSSIFLEHWKRKQSKLAFEWGQNAADEESSEDATNTTNLPSFRGKTRRSPVNDNMNEIYYPYIFHMIKKLFAYLVSIGIVIVVIIIVLYLLYFRNWLVVNKVWGVGNKVIINMPTVLNVVQIAIFNFLYTKLAYAFNSYENHKTYDSYESSLATKVFMFQFVNSFNSIIIISFIKRWIDFMGGCVKNMQFGKSVSAYNYCDEELENQMVTIAIMNFFKNFSELGVPWLLNKYRNMKKVDKSKEERLAKDPTYKLRKSLDYQYELNDFNVGFIDSTFDDYLELTIQFGFVILFAMSFSLLPMIAFVTNIMEIQVDKTKLMYLSKRPNPISANSIGNWFYIFEVLSFLAIFSNLGILVFTYNNYYELTDLNKATLFICLVSFYIICKLAISRFIPDVSQISIEIKSRHKFVVDKNYDGVAEEAITGRKFKVDLNVHCGTAQ